MQIEIDNETVEAVLKLSRKCRFGILQQVGIAKDKDEEFQLRKAIFGVAKEIRRERGVEWSEAEYNVKDINQFIDFLKSLGKEYEIGESNEILVYELTEQEMDQIADFLTEKNLWITED